MKEIITLSKKIEISLFWIFLFITIFGNLMISVILVPIMLVITEIYLYAIVSFIGFCFGFLLNYLLNSIEKLDKKKHIITGIIIPAIALINIMIFTKLSNNLIILLNLQTNLHAPLLLSILYVFFFSLPYLFSKMIKFKKLTH
jgi:hypothetical protein